MKLGALSISLALTLVGCGRGHDRAPRVPVNQKETSKMHLGAFSVSLAVKDLAASRAFYSKLGFSEVMGDASQNWLILRNGETTIGLFHGMFERNMLTFNPGWSSLAKPLDKFDDVRTIQTVLKATGVALTSETDEAATGPGSLTLIDPDGNPILIDQHVE
jgi:lactoylglutathione lyase